MKIKKRFRKTKPIKKLYLMLENVEMIKIPKSSIKKFSYRFRKKAITQLKLVCDSKIDLLTFHEQYNIGATKRILEYNDITWINICYADGKEDRLFIKWHDEDDDDSRFQKSSFDGENLIIKINAVAEK